ncbi:chemotaxis protein CheB [Marilutibacter maris]|uniref:chemotaxis protein CheB n=1 Tax=Marilutibacter maris TaxID=1605891 RepID=UPI001B883700|nr:chemotaxis protein CheB [Lysobacter maris]
MTEPVRRVALLVRHPAAGERLRSLLAEAGIESVLQGDPTQIAVESLTQASPEVVLVALDPDIEDALERFESVLGNPGIDVIYEEAELAAAREGWEAARWKRHLLAKLQGHDRVLPPRPDGAHDEPALRLSSVPEVSDEDYAAFDPVDGFDVPEPERSSPAPAGAADPAAPAIEAGPVENSTLETTKVETTAFEAAPFETAVSPEVPSPSPPPIEAAADEAGPARPQAGYAFDPVNAEDAADAGSPDEATSGFEISFDATAVDSDDNGDLEFSESDSESGGFDIVFDDGTQSGTAPKAPAEPSFGLDEHLRSLSLEPQQESDAAAGSETIDATAAAAEQPAAGTTAAEAPAAAAPVSASTFGELTLDDGNGSYAPADARADDERFGRDLADLDQRIASLELVEDHVDARLPGAVLVLAGIGGPDAVRQLLGALPVDFPRPVLVQQRLDGGRYDRLVAQMQRATTLPVHLAEPGRMAMAGFVYVLPAGLGIETAADGMRFVGEGQILPALPSADSAVLLLSGSDPADVDAVLKHRVGGALVAGQSAEGCYDPAAPEQLAARGGDLAAPTDLAQRLAERWPG